MKILVCGAYGQLGEDCVTVFSEDHDIIAADIDELDITDSTAVREAVDCLRPDWIVNCAAYTSVDNCETDREAAWRLNAQGPANLASAATAHDCRLLHISTDYVFDGYNPVPHGYTEKDPVNPISVYGQTKMEGEWAVLESGHDHCIVRTAWLYGAGGHNFLKTMLGLAMKNSCRPVRVVADQFGSPTWSATLARQMKLLVEKGGCGLYHATAEGYCSWYDLALYFFKQMELMHAVTPCPSDAYPTPAPRPKNSILENSRLKAEGLSCMQNWQDDVDRFVHLYRRRLMDGCLTG